MSILLIGPPTRQTGYTSPPLGPFRIKHHLEKNGFACDLYDPDLKYLISSNNKPKDYKIIAISGNHFAMSECLSLVHSFAERQKQKPLLVAGGIVPTNDFETWLDVGFDVICLGYGEKAFLSLAQRYTQGMGKSQLAQTLSQIEGIAYRGGDEIVHQPPAALTKESFNYYSYQLPLEQFLPYELYWSFNEKVLAQAEFSFKNFIIRTARLYTSSQCPNRCGYCAAKFMKNAMGFRGRRFALKASEILDLIIDSHQKYGCENIFFNDDEFLCDRSMIHELCHLIMAAKSSGRLPSDLSFDCQSRAVDFIRNHQVDEELVHLLEKAGFNRISLGVETFSERLLNTPVMNKAHYTQEEMYEIINTFQESSLNIQINFMLLIPEAKPDEVLYNVRCILDLIKKGVIINLNAKIMASPGAPAIDNPQYEIVTTEIISPLNHKHFVIPDYFQPHDPTLKRLSTTLEQQLSKKKYEYLSIKNTDQYFQSGSVRALILCLALLELMGEKMLYQQASILLKELL